MPAKKILLSAAISSALFANITTAAEWQVASGISLGGYLSDNGCLDDSDQENRTVGTVTPDINLKGSGARANMSLRAAVEYDSLADSGSDCNAGSGRFNNQESLIPSLQFDGELALAENWLTLEGDAFVGRNSADPFASGTESDLNARSNTNITYQYGTAAVAELQPLDNTDLRVRYGYNEQYNELNALGDSNEEEAQFNFGTNPAENTFSTGISGNYSKVTYEKNTLTPGFDNTLASAEVRTALWLSSSWQLNGLMGEEWNEFTSSRDDIDGGYWDAGLLWTPNARIEVGAGTGERFYGTSPRMHIRYRHKRSELTANYARTLSQPRNLRTETDDPEGIFGPDFNQLPDAPVNVSGLPTFIGNTPVLNERLTLKYRFTGRRTSASISISESQQTQTEDLTEATFSDISTLLNRELSANLSAHIRLQWSERDGQDTSVDLLDQHTETWRFGLGFSRHLTPKTTLSTGYQFTRQDADIADNDYDENRLTFSVRHTF